MLFRSRVQEEHGRGLDRGIVPDLDLSAPGAAHPSDGAAAEPAATTAPRPDFTLGSDLIRLDPPPLDPKP